MPRDTANIRINPHWEAYRRRSAVPLKDEPERLTSNWLRMAEAPDAIHFFEASGAAAASAVQRLAQEAEFPVSLHGTGFFTFAEADEIDDLFAGTGRFTRRHSIPLMDFVEGGFAALGLQRQDASNITTAMFRKAWENLCREKGLLEYRYSGASGFHVSADQSKIGDRIYWGHQGDRRWSMLRNIAKGHVWQFGVTGLPSFWPYPHFKIKSRVLFAPPAENDGGEARSGPPLANRQKPS